MSAYAHVYVYIRVKAERARTRGSPGEEGRGCGGWGRGEYRVPLRGGRRKNTAVRIGEMHAEYASPRHSESMERNV